MKMKTVAKCKTSDQPDACPGQPEKAVEAFNSHSKILRSTGNLIHTPRGDADKNDQPERRSS
jgi:hypothetical protein